MCKCTGDVFDSIWAEQVGIAVLFAPFPQYVVTQNYSFSE